MTWSVRRRGDLPLLHSSLLEALPEISHAVSMRSGGVSEGPYASLNLAAGTGDDRERVHENRRRFCEAAEAPFEPLSWCEQVLGADVVQVSEPVRASRPKADALVTAVSRLPLLTFSADCLLLLLCDPVRRVVANVHASRQGTFEEIARNAVETMQKTFDCRPRDLVAAIGPSIGPCCYSLRDEILTPWLVRHEYAPRVLADGRLDLGTANRLQLEQAGVLPDRIDEARMCTRCTPDLFYSYRRDGEKTGRFGALIWLR